MSLLIVNAAERDTQQVQRAIELLAQTTPEHQVIDAAGMDIRPCMGCYVCMLKTPGLCAIRDDYHTLMEAYVRADDIVFLFDTALDFVNHKAKNIVDRMFPLISLLTQYVSGEIRHIPRYPRQRRIGVLYTGSADRDHMTFWVERVAKNMMGTSLEARPVEEAEEMCAWILS